jgi:hypothetical protein
MQSHHAVKSHLNFLIHQMENLNIHFTKKPQEPVESPTDPTKSMSAGQKAKHYGTEAMHKAEEKSKEMGQGAQEKFQHAKEGITGTAQKLMAKAKGEPEPAEGKFDLQRSRRCRHGIKRWADG